MPSGVAYRRAANYFDGPVQRRHHRLEDDVLLIVLLPETSDLGIQDIEQFCLPPGSGRLQNDAGGRGLRGTALRAGMSRFTSAENCGGYISDSGEGLKTRSTPAVAAFGQIGFDGPWIFMKILAPGRTGFGLTKMLTATFSACFFAISTTATNARHEARSPWSGQDATRPSVSHRSRRQSAMVWVTIMLVSRMYHARAGSRLSMEAASKT